MENAARLYNCARCHRQVAICSYCDRGNIYCGKSCTDLARKTSLRMAGKRYQRSYRGRLKHAERQRCYRSRHKKVTHQGSPEPPSNDPLATWSETPGSIVATEVDNIRCHFCGRPCCSFLRLDFMHRAMPIPASNRKNIHRPPPVWAQAP
jgi:hypothetical protein